MLNEFRLEQEEDYFNFLRMSSAANFNYILGLIEADISKQHPLFTNEQLVKDSVKALHTCSRFFKYLKTYAFYPHKGIYFLEGNKILYKIVVLCFTFK